MALTPEMRAFIDAPDTVDFITRSSDAFLDFVRTSGQVLLTQRLNHRYLLGYIKARDFPNLARALGPAFLSSVPVVLGPLDRADLESSGILQVQDQPYLGLRGQGVLLGIVDTGIDYTQPVFRYEDGSSKIRFLYDQSAQGTPPEGFTQGVEYTGEQITAALKARDPYAAVPQRDENGHGTFLASVAAGRPQGDFTGAAPDAGIIAVKLRPAREFYREMYCVPPGQQYAYASTAVMVGVEYIRRKARELDQPVVICLGLGTNFGGHDGFSVFEEFLSGVAVQSGVCLCAAGGNEGQERHHAEGRLAAAGDSRTIDLKIGERAGDVYLAVWNGLSDRLSLSVRSPSGELVGRVPARSGRREEVKLILEDARVQVEYHFPLEGTGSQVSVVRILGATPGIWTVTVHGDQVLSGVYHAWLPMAGFVSPTVEFLSASPRCTVTSPATAIGLMACGAYNSANHSIYPPSSRGPSRLGALLPDLVAPGVGVGGFYPFGHGEMSGTSAAAAILAGACALLMQWGVVEGNEPAMSTSQIRAYLLRGCVRSPAVTYPNDQWGYGALQLMQAFHLMREI